MAARAKPPSPANPKRDTVTRFMDAAEALFIRRGYEGTSVRAISAKAKVSLGTIVYHWGTKEELFRDLCMRRFGDISEQQLLRLRACEESWDASAPVAVEAVVRALVEPPLLAFTDPELAQTTRHLYGRALTDPSPVVLRVTDEIFSEPSRLFWKLLRNALPGLSEETFYWRYNCALGGFIIAPSFHDRIAFGVHMDALNTDWGIVTDEIVATMVAGLERGQ